MTKHEKKYLWNTFQKFSKDYISKVEHISNRSDVTIVANAKSDNNTLEATLTFETSVNSLASLLMKGVNADSQKVNFVDQLVEVARRPKLIVKGVIPEYISASGNINNYSKPILEYSLNDSGNPLKLSDSKFLETEISSRNKLPYSLNDKELETMEKCKLLGFDVPKGHIFSSGEPYTGLNNERKLEEINRVVGLAFDLFNVPQKNILAYERSK